MENLELDIPMIDEILDMKDEAVKPFFNKNKIKE